MTGIELGSDANRIKGWFRKKEDQGRGQSLDNPGRYSGASGEIWEIDGEPAMIIRQLRASGEFGPEVLHCSRGHARELRKLGLIAQPRKVSQQG